METFVGFWLLLNWLFLYQLCLSIIRYRYKARAGLKPDRALFGKNVGARPHINVLTLMYKNIR